MPQLNRYERIAYDMLCRAASKGEPCPSNLDIEIEIGANSTSVAPVVVRMLEERHGLIRVERYQRARTVTILATGEKTALPPNHKTSKPHVQRGARAVA